jgi:hypothetical protein
MARRRTKRARGPKHDPMAMPLTRWGTKAQGKHNEQLRKLKNRIHELEQEHEGNLRALANLHAQIQALRDNHANVPTSALKLVCSLTAQEMATLGIVGPMMEIARWYLSLIGVHQRSDRVASGKVP